MYLMLMINLFGATFPSNFGISKEGTKLLTSCGSLILILRTSLSRTSAASSVRPRTSPPKGLKRAVTACALLAGRVTISINIIEI